MTFRDSTESPCGEAGEATGPFYCPGDEKVYLDFGFFDELKSRFGGSNAEFAQAYVVAHELGHHVQKILGIESKVSRLQRQNPSQGNALSVDTELQADCLAGVWGHSAQARNIINVTDIQAAMSAAAAVGDDRLQKMATGHVTRRSSRMALPPSALPGCRRVWIRATSVPAIPSSRGHDGKLKLSLMPHSRHRTKPFLLMTLLVLSALPAVSQTPAVPKPNAQEVEEMQKFLAIGKAPNPAAVERGKQKFISTCSFCHGANAHGGQGGPDLIRSTLVLHDNNGRQDWVRHSAGPR